jgi:DNA-binding transcriptional ArsR family regulator
MGDKQNLEKRNQSAEAYMARIEGLLGALKSEEVRWLMGREKEIEQNSGMSDQTFKELFAKIVKQEAERSAIVSELSKKNGGTIRELAFSTGIQQKSILRHVIALMKKGSVAVAGQKDDEYLFNSTLPPE